MVWTNMGESYPTMRTYLLDTSPSQGSQIMYIVMAIRLVFTYYLVPSSQMVELQLKTLLSRLMMSLMLA